MTSILRPPRAAAATLLAGGSAAIDLDDWLTLIEGAWLAFDDSGRITQRSSALQALALRWPKLDNWPVAWRELLGWPGQLPPPHQVHERMGWLALTSPPERTGEGNEAAPAPVRVRVRGLRALPSPRWIAHIEDRSAHMAAERSQRELQALTDALGVSIATHDPALGWLAPAPRTPMASAAPSSRQPYVRAISREVVNSASLPQYEQLQRALRERSSTEVSYTVQDPERGARRLHTWVQPLGWSAAGDGRDALAVMTLDESSDQQAVLHARAEAARSAAQLDALFASSRDGLALLDGETIVRANPRLRQHLHATEPAAAPHSERLSAMLQALGAPEALVTHAWRQLAQHGEGELEFVAGAAGPAGEAAQWPSTAPRRWLQVSLRQLAPAAEAPAGQRQAGGSPTALAIVRDTSRQRMQQAELESLARERELMFSLSDVGILVQRDGRIARTNEAMAELLDRPLGTLEGLPMAELFADERAYLAYRSRERRNLEADGRSRAECQLQRANGTQLWVQASVRPVDAHDLDAGTIASFVSVDDRRRARESLQTQGERTRAILDSVLVGIVTVGSAGIEWMNRSARRMFGGELADFVGEPICTVATSDADHPLRKQQWLSSLREGQTDTFECVLQARDGRTFWVVGNVVATGQQQQQQLTLALLDIQRRREAEHHIAQARASLQRIIETAPMAIALFDARTQTVLQLNEAMTRLALRNAAEIEGRPPALWLPSPEAASLSADLHHAMAERETAREWVRAGDPATGAPLRVWDMRIVALDATGGMGAQLLLVASDVTEQRAADEARLQAAIAQREMLVREVHHRIKNNLQGVAGLLQQNVQRHPQAAVAISEAVGQVHAIAQVHGLQVGVTGPLRVRSVIEAITQSVQRMFGREIVFQVSGPAAHRFALTEADSIPVALTVNELLTNAIKHAQDPSTPIACELAIGTEDLLLTIRNPGQLKPGFALEDIPSGISGLGLVRALLPRKGATIRLTQQGAQVHATLHLARPAIALLEPL